MFSSLKTFSQARLNLLLDPKIPWALVVSSFINKCGEMAINLLPMLLIERHVSSGTASLILGVTKSASLFGLFLGGILTDALGFKFIILSSFFIGFVGFTTLPFLTSNFLIAGFATLAQFGASLFHPSARAMVREHGGLSTKKSMAWLRTSSNLGQVVSATFGIILGPLGILIPFLLDGGTSFLAFVIGFFNLKNPQKNAAHNKKGKIEKGYFQYSLALTCFTFVYELGFLSFSGFAKLSLGNQGIRAFSIVLLINTFLCGALAVPAAHYFHNSRKTLTLGTLLATFGLILMTLLPKTFLNFAICALIMSSGEVLFAVHAQTLLLLNSTGKTSKHYGFSMMIQSSGKLIAAVILFPLVLRAEYPSWPFIVGILFFMILLYTLPKQFLQKTDAIAT